ncbi:MAG: FtsH protease activity modulator HflK [Magnetococcales bacterium]|nr:FtsH protease activity modulator HflK [Magnetococcales bacterium]
MSWNNDGGGPNQGPWGPVNRQPQPPDVEKILRMARERFSGNLPGGRMWPAVAALAVLGWMASGIYVVEPDEEGVVVRFGKYVETYKSGLHYHLPYPIETVYKPKVTVVRRIEIGYRTRGHNTADMPVESLMLTGDENIIDIDMSVQYLINNTPNYLFNLRNPAQDPDKVVRDVAETAIRQVIGRNSIDEALTTGKDRIQSITKEAMQEILNSYNSGLSIVAVQLQQVAPPEEVIQAFKDVASAREDRERAINEAQGYRSDILPKAKGEAAKVVQEAEAYKTAKVARAQGDASRFTSLLTEYEKAREVTRTRIYLETMEEVMSGVHKVIIDGGASNGVLPYLPLDSNRRRAPDPHASTGKGGAP